MAKTQRTGILKKLIILLGRSYSIFTTTRIQLFLAEYRVAFELSRFSLNSTFGSGSIKTVTMSGERFCICSCEHCGEYIGFPASGVGMRVACPHCAVETVLTEPQEQAAEKLDPISAAELKEALAGTVTRRRISVFYQAGFALVALFMVLLPVAYLAFVAFDYGSNQSR